ncbi:hypothetical protein BH09DEP1_BH09DEP1_7870 [soil metagenome]
MIIPIVLSILFFMNSAGMEKVPSYSQDATKDLHALLLRAHTIVMKTSFHSEEENANFDASQEGLFPRVAQLLSKGANPNYAPCLVLPMLGNMGMQLPSNRELMQKIGYSDIECLLKSEKEKSK